MVYFVLVVDSKVDVLFFLITEGGEINVNL